MTCPKNKFEACEKCDPKEKWEPTLEEIWKHGDEGTHFVCNEILARDGGKSLCCGYTKHECKQNQIPPMSTNEERIIEEPLHVSAEALHECNLKKQKLIASTRANAFKEATELTADILGEIVTIMQGYDLKTHESGRQVIMTINKVIIKHLQKLKDIK